MNLQDSIPAVLAHGAHCYTGVAARIRGTGTGHSEDLASREDLHPRGKSALTTALTPGVVPARTSQPSYHTTWTLLQTPEGSPRQESPKLYP